MAKRAKKIRKAKLSQAQLLRPSAQVAAETPLVQDLPGESAILSSSAGVDFGQEYHYVIEDLKRIGALAAGMLVVLLVLSFFI